MTGFDYVHTVTGEVVRSEDFDPLERDEAHYQRRARRGPGGSALGDRIIRDGPFAAGAVLPEWVKGPLPAAEWNALRDELIELRGRAAHVAAMAHNAEVVHSDVPPEALRWKPGEWRGCAPAGMVAVTFGTDDMPAMPGPPVTEIRPVACGQPIPARAGASGRCRLSYGHDGDCAPVTTAAIEGDFLAPVAAGDIRPGDVASVVGGQIRVYRDTVGPGAGLACLVCGRPVERGMVECTACAGADEAAAKRQADR